MRIEILDEAKSDLIQGFHFYEQQSPGLGSYFLDSLSADIDSLLLYAGIHRVVFGSHRLVASRFPFAIYYQVDGEVIRIRAVIVLGGIPTRLDGGLTRMRFKPALGWQGRRLNKFFITPEMTWSSLATTPFKHTLSEAAGAWLVIA